MSVVSDVAKSALKRVRGWLRGDADLQDLRERFLEERSLLSPHVASAFGTWRVFDAVAQLVGSMFLVFLAGLLLSILGLGGVGLGLLWGLVLTPAVLLGTARLAQRVEKRRLRVALSRLALPPSRLRGLGHGSSVAVGTALLVSGEAAASPTTSSTSTT